ncbi:MAG TPA: hypothetical protein VMZ53_10345 [Kofleriaceae bacterium]|nr:hypothetical protein [Kofleriaceae bacterium]
MGGVASAQPGPPPQPPPPPVDTTTTTTTTTTEQTPVVTNTTPTPVVVASPTPQPQPVAESAGPRPDGMALGLGVGYQLPTSLETPNITSFRLRLAGGLTLEPAFAVSNESETAEAAGVEATNKHTVFSLFAMGRLPLISRGKADFEGLARLGFTNDKDNPDGDFNTTTTNRFGVGWGIAVGYWFSPHWQLSFNVTNDLIDFTSRKTQAGPGMTTKQSSTEIGLIFAPSVFMMLHLYN